MTSIKKYNKMKNEQRDRTFENLTKKELKMTIIETIGLACFYAFVLIVFFAIIAGIMALLERIGFNNWLRGWLWYFGIIDKCPDNNKNKGE